jgi:hypothetical protein
MMDNYFKPNDFEIENIYLPENNDIDEDYYITKRLKKCNRYISGMIQQIKENELSVKILEYVDNDLYDKLLTENIVFLNLINASGCNTVIECIVRNTPIIVNRLPALEEVLGNKYPLFYDNMAEASSFATNKNKIKEAYRYLKSLNKDKLKIETFIDNMNAIITE